MQQQRAFTCGPANGWGKYTSHWIFATKVLHGPFQQNSILIPFQSKSIFRNAEKGKTTATNQ